MSFPTRTEVESVLVALVNATMSPEQAQSWAATSYVDESTHPEDTDTDMDWAAWHGLDLLMGADDMVNATTYLFGHDDYVAWLEDFRAKATDTNPP